MWRRFSDDAKLLVTLSQELAAQRGEHQVSTEVLLMALVSLENCKGAQVLADLHITKAAIYAAIEKRSPCTGIPIKADCTLTPCVQKAVDRASQAAERCSDPKIGTEHLLLGLLDQEHGAASRVLQDMGVHSQQVELALGLSREMAAKG